MKYLLMSLVSIPVLVSGRAVLAQEMQGTTAPAIVSATVTGKKNFPDGSEYTGELQNGKRHGKGVAVWPDGLRYEGEWQDDKRHGHGKSSNKGESYTGEYRNDLKDGVGRYVWATGSTYEGEFRNGAPHGFGVIRNIRGLRYEGAMANGKENGFGWTEVNADNAITLDIAKVLFGVPTGAYERISLDVGDTYTSEYRNGLVFGAGWFVQKNGKRQQTQRLENGTLKLSGDSTEPTELTSNVAKARQAAQDAQRRATEQVAKTQSILQQMQPAGNGSNMQATLVPPVPVNPRLAYTATAQTPQMTPPESRTASQGSEGSISNPGATGSSAFPAANQADTLTAVTTSTVASTPFDVSPGKQVTVNTIPNAKATSPGKPLRYPDGSSYTGGLLNGKRHGSGTMLWRDGDSYSGEFQHDQKQGIGRYGFADGSFLLGQWQKNQFSGLGLAVFKDGTRYEGEWLNGEKHGYGRITLANGKTYTGEFRKDKLEGWGRAVQPDGSRTDAKWTKDAPDGVAVFVWPNGAIDDQVLRAGFIRSEVRRQPGALPAKPVQALSEQVEKAVQAALTASKRATEQANSAQAVAQSVNPAIPPVPVFQAVTPVIVATPNTVPPPVQGVAANAAVVQPVTAPAPKPVAQTEINGTKVFGDEVGKAQQGVYEGALVNGVRQGYGVMAFSDGRRYEGEWRNDQFNGYGELIRANGIPVYVGEWKNGQYHGKGRATYGPNGNVEWREGDWNYGQPSGRSVWHQRVDGLEVLEIYNAEGDRISEQVVTPAQSQGNNSSILAAAATALAQMRQKASVPDIVAAQQRGIAMAQQAQPRPAIPSPQPAYNNYAAANTVRVATPETSTVTPVKPASSSTGIPYIKFASIAPDHPHAACAELLRPLQASAAKNISYDCPLGPWGEKSDDVSAASQNRLCEIAKSQAISEATTASKMQIANKTLRDFSFVGAVCQCSGDSGSSDASGNFLAPGSRRYTFCRAAVARKRTEP